MAMTEDDFWVRLELRICAELGGMDGEPARFWCDGLTPFSYRPCASPREALIHT